MIDIALVFILTFFADMLRRKAAFGCYCSKDFKWTMLTCFLVLYGYFLSCNFMYVDMIAHKNSIIFCNFVLVCMFFIFKMEYHARRKDYPWLRAILANICFTLYCAGVFYTGYLYTAD